MTATPDDDAPLDPAAMLALAGAQKHRIETLDLGNVVGMLVAWGIAWGVGFLALWAGVDPDAPVTLPVGVGATVFGVLVAAGIAVSIVLGTRMSRGMRGSARFAGMVYGWSWTGGTMGAWVIGVGLMRAGMSSDLALLFFPAVYSLVVGLLYLAAAAIWPNRPQLILGVWMIVVGSLATFAGAPLNLPIMAVAGGGGFLVGALVMAVSLRRSARRG